MYDSDKSFRENKLEKKSDLVKDGDGYNLDTVCRRGITGIITSIKYRMIRLGEKSFSKTYWHKYINFLITVIVYIIVIATAIFSFFSDNSQSFVNEDHSIF